MAKASSLDLRAGCVGGNRVACAERLKLGRSGLSTPFPFQPLNSAIQAPRYQHTSVNLWTEPLLDSELEFCS